MNQFFATLATALCIGVLTPSPSTSIQVDSIKQVVSYSHELLPSKDEQPLSDRQVVAVYLREYENSPRQIQCALSIAYDESRYNNDSVNAETGAHGVFQLMHKTVYPAMSTHVRKATEYMKYRYGTWCEAKQFHDRNGWW